MMRLVVLVVVAGLCVWVLALLPTRSPTAPRHAEDRAEPEAALARFVAQARPAQAPNEKQPAAAPRRVAASEPDEAPLVAQPERTDPFRYRVQTQTQRARLKAPEALDDAVEEATAEAEALPGEQGQGLLSEEYRGREQDYFNEPRDFDWAHPHEHALREIIVGAGLAPKLVLIACRVETCRLVMEATDTGEVDSLLALPGLQEVTGLSPQDPYSLRGGQLVMYFRPSSPDPTTPGQNE